MKHLLIRFSLVLLVFPIIYGESANCQPDTLKTWHIVSDGISCDPLGNFYIFANNSIIKYSPKGDSVGSWSEPITGRISMTDTGDPLRILIYQADFNLLRYLNNRLAPLADPVSLDDIGITAPLALATCRQGGFWVLDGTTRRLRRISQQLTGLVESAPLNLNTKLEFQTCKLIEEGEHVYLMVQDKEIVVFDLFANFVRKIPIRVQSTGVQGNLLILVSRDRVVLWKDPVSPEEILWSDPDGGILDACLWNNRLLIRKSDRIDLVSYKK